MLCSVASPRSLYNVVDDAHHFFTTICAASVSGGMEIKMEDILYNEERNLSVAESLVMKAVWDAGEDIAVPDLMTALKVKYGKEYARTTVQTFLLKLSGKGFVRVYRRGKLSYVHAVKAEEDYKAKLLREEVDFWYQGNPIELFFGLFQDRKLTEEDRDQIRRALDGLED